MLISLQVQNYVLIQSLVFEPQRGLNTMTGETGAGKSILIGALGLILGDRADSKAVASNAGKCIVEGTFDLSELSLESLFQDHDLDFEPHTIMRREILESGRSRAFVNDTPVSLNTLKSLGQKLVDIHSQHQTHQISDVGFMFNWLDAVSDSSKLFETYQSSFKQLRIKQKSLTDLLDIEQRENAQADYNNFLWEELDNANLQPSELKDLDAEGELLQNAEEIGQLINQVFEKVKASDQSMIDELNGFIRQLAKLTPSDSELENITQRVQSIVIELDDAVTELNALGDGLQTDSSRLDTINNRLQLIQQLFTKHRAKDVEELVTIRERLSENLYAGVSRKHEIEILQQEVRAFENQANELATGLHDMRIKGAKEAKSIINAELKYLGLPNAMVEMHLEESPTLTQHGKSIFQLKFASNKGQAAQSAHRVASGGELSRLMLILKSQMAKKKRLPTLIFDEIDTGVSGEIAIRMAEVMADLSKHLQVVSITHLPQIAARGSRQFFVFKEDNGGATQTQLKVLNDSERVQEIAKMLSGDQPTEGALINAQDLLNQANKSSS